MIFNGLTSFGSLSLLLLRIIVALVFLSSGWSHVTKPEERSKSIEMSKTFTLLLGLGEITGGILVILGLWIQIGAIILIGVMIGAIWFKISRWNIGFFSSETTGWHYDLLLLSANLAFLTIGGGNYSLTKLL